MTTEPEPAAVPEPATELEPATEEKPGTESEAATEEKPGTEPEVENEPKPATEPEAATERKLGTEESIKLDLFEDDDELVELDSDEEWELMEENTQELIKQWEDDWDNDDVEDNFSLHLRQGYENTTEKKSAGCLSLLTSAPSVPAGSHD